MSKPKDIFSTEKAVQKYLPLAYEMAQRLDIVAAICQNSLDFPVIYARELAYLQFRYVCELIALGALHLHGDLPIASMNRTRKEWHAENIMRSLHKDYPHAFPQSFKKTTEGRKHNFDIGKNPAALTRNEFKKLYEECGKVLHKGTIKKTNSIFSDDAKGLEDVIKWQTKLVALLNAHCISRFGREGFYVISLREKNGCPVCSIFKFGENDTMNINTVNMRIVPKPPLK